MVRWILVCHSGIIYAVAFSSVYCVPLAGLANAQWDGPMSRASVSNFGRLGDSDLAGFNHGRFKPMRIKLIHGAS